MANTRNKNNSFTLLETLLVVGLFGFLAAVLIPFSIQELNKSRAENSAKTLVMELHSQQQNAVAAVNDLSYGISLLSDGFNSFSAYSTDNVYQTTNYKFEAGVSVLSYNLSNGANKIYFSKYSVKPDVWGDITVGDGVNSYLININSEGLVGFHKL